MFGSVRNGTDYHLYEDISSDLGYSPSVTILAPHNTVTVGGNVTYGLLHSGEFWYGSAPVPTVSGYNNAWDEHDERLLASAYAQDDVGLFDHTVHITPGVKFLDAYTISSDAIGIYYPIGGTVANNQHFVSPTLGINYAPLPGFSVYASWGRNIKFPNIGAYYSNIAETNAAGQYVVVPVSIKPEYVTDYELGTRYRHAGFLGSVDAYREYFTNTFVNVTNPTTALSTTTNGGRSRYQGIELTLEQHFGHILVGRWLGYANYSYNQAVFTSSFHSTYAGQVSAGQPLANVPKNMVNVGLGWRLGGIDARIGAKYVGPQYVNQQFAGSRGPQDPRLHGHQHRPVRYHPAPRGRRQKREARLEHRQCLQPPLCRGRHQQLRLLWEPLSVGVRGHAVFGVWECHADVLGGVEAGAQTGASWVGTTACHAIDIERRYAARHGPARGPYTKY
ncbi:TonB-dependent receptor [Acidiferrobacter sp. SPIII_3]|uniref:TonB-dependent receptor n=1 Tax=Acidiferrobacter sp. SPIII_3 TaxID=1281578 RepID=UPI002101134A|nr:TonB-dependent receptor [Acidiferrobacter sp. SPIII_3]